MNAKQLPNHTNMKKMTKIKTKNNQKIKENEILEQLKKPLKHLLKEENDNEILDVWKRFDKDYEKSQ